MPRGRPHESYLKDAGMAGLATAWAMARRRPKEYRRKVDAATRCSAYAPIPDLLPSFMAYKIKPTPNGMLSN